MNSGTRHAHMRGAPHARRRTRLAQAIECAWFARWAEAAQACELLESAEAHSHPRHLEWAHILAMPLLGSQNTFHFVQAACPFVHVDVHVLDTAVEIWFWAAPMRT